MKPRACILRLNSFAVRVRQTNNLDAGAFGLRARFYLTGILEVNHIPPHQLTSSGPPVRHDGLDGASERASILNAHVCVNTGGYHDEMPLRGTGAQ